MSQTGVTRFCEWDKFSSGIPMTILLFTSNLARLVITPNHGIRVSDLGLVSVQGHRSPSIHPSGSASRLNDLYVFGCNQFVQGSRAIALGAMDIFGRWVAVSLVPAANEFEWIPRAPEVSPFYDIYRDLYSCLTTPAWPRDKINRSRRSRYACSKSVCGWYAKKTAMAKQQGLSRMMRRGLKMLPRRGTGVISFYKEEPHLPSYHHKRGQYICHRSLGFWEFTEWIMSHIVTETIAGIAILYYY